MNTAATYIFSYEAKIEPNGTVKGRIEAKHGLDAKQKVQNNNLLVKSVTVKALKNQSAARNQPYEK